MRCGRCAGDRSAKRLRLLAEASLQHCLLAAAAAAEEQQLQQERAAEQLYRCQHDNKGGSPAAEHAGPWAQPMKPQVDAEADLLQKAAADAIRLAEGKCQVRLGAASSDLCAVHLRWPSKQDTVSGFVNVAEMLVIAALTCCAAP